MKAEDVAASLSELDSYLAELGGCTDGYCKVVRPKGMHTNGGCRCLRSTFTAERVVYAYQRFTDAVRSHLLQERGE